MATRIASSTGYAEAIVYVGAKLNLVFSISSDGTIVTFTGNDLTAELFDQSKSKVADPTVTLSDYTEPDTGNVTSNAVVTVSDIPANLPTRQGDYMLVIKRTASGDSSDTDYPLRVRCKFVHPAFDL